MTEIIIQKSGEPTDWPAGQVLKLLFLGCRLRRPQSVTTAILPISLAGKDPEDAKVFFAPEYDAKSPMLGARLGIIE
jgi:hypothetical protein